MNADTIFAAINRAGNKAMLPLVSKSPLGQQLFGRWIAVVSYTGRRSGRKISTPVFYLRQHDVVTIRVALPDSKNWWRNFLGEGRPITLTLASQTHTGHAVAHRDDRGRVTVVAELDPVA